MRTRRLSLAAFLIAAVAAGSCSNSSDSSGGDTTCGTTPTTFDLTKVTRAEVLVIAPDGTVYFSDFGAHVMRYAPPYDKVEPAWATITDGWVFGVMLDPKRKVIYAGSRAPKSGTTVVSNPPPGPTIYKIDITDPTKVTRFAEAAPGVNGLTMGDDGSLYFADQCCDPGKEDAARGHIYRVTPDGVKTQVTKTPIDNADGIAFGPDKKLYVIPYLGMTCPITRLTLDSTFTESARDVYVDITAQGGLHGDGIAFDKSGNVYLTAGALFKVTPDKVVTKLSPQGGANIEFGAGALSCSEIVWATNSNMVAPQHMNGDIAGQDVYWHRN
jgi:sugar lactone lactonase YvrE